MTTRQPIQRFKSLPIGVARIRTASLKDVSWIERLQRIFSNQIGFIPRSAIRERIRRHDVLLASLDNDPAGFILIGGGTRSPVHMSQCAVDLDLWGKGIGRTTIEAVLEHTQRLRFKSATAKIREDIPIMLHVADITGGSHVATSIESGQRGHRCTTWQWRGQSEPLTTEPGIPIEQHRRHRQ